MIAPFRSTRRAIAASIYFVTVALSSVLAQSGSAAGPSPVFASQESDLEFAGVPGSATFILKADNLDDAALAEPLGAITDVGSPAPPSLTLKFIARELDQSANSRRWVVTVGLSGPLPPNVIQRRYANIAFGGKGYLVGFTLTHKPPTFTWNVKGPAGELALPADRSVPVTVITQSVGATNVRIGQVSLYEQSRKHEMPSRLALCPQPTGTCEPARIDIDPLASKRLWLRPTTDDAIVGKYVGTVNIASDEKPEGETISNLTIYGTTWCRQALGVIAILLGVVAAWITTTWIQNRLNRAQLLLPAASLATRAGELRNKLLASSKEDDPANVANTLRGLNEVISALSEATLETKGFIPSKWPNPAKSNVGSIESYKQYLADAGSKVTILAVYVEEGFVRIWKEATGADDPRIQHFRNASRALDGSLTRDPPLSTAKEVRDQIQIIYIQLQTGLTGAPPPNAVLATLVPQPLSYERIVVEIRQLSLMTWAIFGLLATALGAYVLVFTNLGFGISTDYFACLVWGFGLPASSQLAQSTLASARTAVGITVP